MFLHYTSRFTMHIVLVGARAALQYIMLYTPAQSSQRR